MKKSIKKIERILKLDLNNKQVQEIKKEYETYFLLKNGIVISKENAKIMSCKIENILIFHKQYCISDIEEIELQAASILKLIKKYNLHTKMNFSKSEYIKFMIETMKDKEIKEEIDFLKCFHKIVAKMFSFKNNDFYSLNLKVVLLKNLLYKNQNEDIKASYCYDITNLFNRYLNVDIEVLSEDFIKQNTYEEILIKILKNKKKWG